MFTVNDMMVRKPLTLSSSHTILDAKKLMDTKRIRHIPIVSKDGKLEGLVTQRDILSAQSSSTEKLISEKNDPMQASLAFLLNRSLFTVEPSASLKAAALYMQKHKIGCLPVINQHKLVGIITDSDFIAIAINLLEIQEETEPMDFD